MTFVIVEKNNRNAVHMICDSRERAEYHLTTTIPQYVSRSYYSDKTLTADSFEIIEKGKQ